MGAGIVVDAEQQALGGLGQQMARQLGQEAEIDAVAKRLQLVLLLGVCYVLLVTDQLFELRSRMCAAG